VEYAVNIRQLELFLAVLEHGSVTRAATVEHLSPGAISLQMQKLAAELKTELFTRSGSRLCPTPDAIRLAAHARDVLKRIRQIQQEFAGDPASDVRPFHFACGATTLIHRLRRPLQLLRRHYPKTLFRVTVAATEEMVAGLLDRTYDLALISLPCAQPNLSILPLFEEELLVLRPAHRQVLGWRVGHIRPQEMQAAPFILYPMHSNMRLIMEDWFRTLNIRPHVVMEAEDTEVIKRLVEAGFGYSILPAIALRPRPRFFHAARVPGAPLIRQQALAWLKAEYLRPLTLAVARVLHLALTGKYPEPSVQ
jgi:DNA-binding transcriptional LysR family regulator